MIFTMNTCSQPLKVKQNKKTCNMKPKITSDPWFRMCLLCNTWYWIYNKLYTHTHTHTHTHIWNQSKLNIEIPFLGFVSWPNRYFLSICSIPSTVLDTGEIKFKKRETFLPSQSLPSYGDKKTKPNHSLMEVRNWTAESQEEKTAKWGREQQSSFYASQPQFFLPQTVLQNGD